MSKIALITGANKGIGKEIAKQLGKSGVTVILSARDAQKVAEAAQALQAEGIQAESIVLDVTKQATIDKAAAYISKKYGHLDILVNNTGICIGREGPDQFNVEAFKKTYDTNVFGVVRVTGAMAPLLKAAGHGRIVNMSSVLGSLAATSTSSDMPLLSTYNSSKSALNALTVTYSRLFKNDGIKVNSACPGYTATDLNSFQGIRTVQQAAVTPVRLALLPDDGPTGGFFNDEGTVAW